MAQIKLTTEYGLLLRVAALQEKNIERSILLKALDGLEPFDESPELISFGPCFGQEAMESLSKNLMLLGLEYFEDFFECSLVAPQWCTLYAAPTVD